MAAHPTNQRGIGQRDIDGADAPPAPAAPASTTHVAPRPRSSAAATVVAALAVIAALWAGQRFLIPVTAGLMLAMLVMPFAVRLERLIRSRIAASVVALALVMSTLAAGAVAFGGQLLRVAERAPEMISIAAQQLAQQRPTADSMLTRSRDALHELDRAADKVIGDKTLTKSKRRAAANVNTPDTSISAGATVALRESALTGSTALLTFVGNLSIIFFVAFFVLAGGKPLTERLLNLWGYHPHALQRASSAVVECARQIRIYCGVMLVTNVAIGLVVWIIFMIADLPDPAGWGATAAILHVVPYLGMALLTGLGAAETFLAYESIGAALGMAALLVLVSTLVGTLGTAWLQGRAARMNAAAVFIGLVFWGALWGVWGLFLGPPLVVILKVIAEHSQSGYRFAKLMQG